MKLERNGLFLLMLVVLLIALLSHYVTFVKIDFLTKELENISNVALNLKEGLAELSKLNLSQGREIIELSKVNSIQSQELVRLKLLSKNSVVSVSNIDYKKLLISVIILSVIGTSIGVGYYFIGNFSLNVINASVIGVSNSLSTTIVKFAEKVGVKFESVYNVISKDGMEYIIRVKGTNAEIFVVLDKVPVDISTYLERIAAEGGDILVNTTILDAVTLTAKTLEHIV